MLQPLLRRAETSDKPSVWFRLHILDIPKVNTQLVVGNMVGGSCRHHVTYRYTLLCPRRSLHAISHRWHPPHKYTPHFMATNEPAMDGNGFIWINIHSWQIWHLWCWGCTMYVYHFFMESERQKKMNWYGVKLYKRNRPTVLIEDCVLKHWPGEACGTKSIR